MDDKGKWPASPLHSRPSKIDFLHEGINVGAITFGTVQYSTLANISIDNLQHCYIFNVPIEGIQEIKIKSSTIYSSDEVVCYIFTSSTIFYDFTT